MPSTDFGDYLTIDFDNCDKLPHGILNNFQSKILPFAASSLYNVEIVAASRLTTGDDVKAVYDIAFDVEDLQYEFEPGDTVGILPSNNNSEVDQLLSRLNLTSVANQQYTLNIISNTTKKKAAIPSHIPANSTIYEVFLQCVDIRSIPKKLFLRSLIRYTSQPDEIELLQNLCSPSGSQQYNEFVTKHRSLLNLLEAFPSCCPPVERLLENLPPLQPRAYSISSSPLSKNSPKQLHITFAVIDLNEHTKGVCTGWLENCIQGLVKTNCQATENIETLLSDLHISSSRKIQVPLYFRKNNNFRLPTVPALPIIMIGPGTGVAPFVGFLEHRFLQSPSTFGASLLFYGCRYDNRDFLFKNRIHQFQENGTLTKLFVCFSREDCKKSYVQDLIIKNKDEVVDLIKRQNAIVYVCGDAKNMLKDIRNAIASCLVDVEGLSNDVAENYIKEMEQTNRYVKDIWL